MSEWDGRAPDGWHWLLRLGTAKHCMAHYNRRDCWYVADAKGRTYRMHEPKVARLFLYVAPAPDPDPDVLAAVDAIDAIVDGLMSRPKLGQAWRQLELEEQDAIRNKWHELLERKHG